MEILALGVLIGITWGMALALLYLGSQSTPDTNGGVLRHDGLALALLGGATLLLFAPVVLGIAWRPAYGGDLLGFLYPTYAFAGQSLHQGQIPLWNPHLYSGAPWAFDVQSGLFYPPNLLTFALLPSLTFRMMELLAVFHFFLAGANSYVCLRLLPWGQRRLGAVSCGIGALAFMFSDFFILHFGNLNLVAAASWLPLFFLGTVLSVERRSWGWGVVGGAALALSILAGHPQPLVYSLFLWGLYLVFEAFRRWRTSAGQRSDLAYAGLPIGVGLGLSAILLLPAYEMVGLTLRARLTYAEASAFSLAPAQLWGLVLPGIFGRGPETFWGLADWERVEIGYLGVIPLALALWALLRLPRAQVRFLGGVALLTLLIALGDHFPLHRLLYELLPGFNQIRVPARWVLVLDFALACLAAFGFEHLRRRLPGPQARSGFQRLLAALLSLVLVGAAGILLVGGPELDEPRRGQILSAAALSALALGGTSLWTQSNRWIAGPPERRSLLLAGLIFFEVGWAAAPVELGWEDPSAAFHHPEAIAFLQEQDGVFRIDTPLEVWYLWQPDLAVMHGLFEIGGIWNPLALGDYHAYYWGLENRSNPLYDFLNARFLVVPKDAPPPDAERWRLAFTSDPSVDLYENQRAYPRFFVVHRALSVPTHDAAWSLLHDPGFDPGSTVVLEGDWPSWEPQVRAEVEVVEYTLNGLRLTVRSEELGYLVASEVMYPGWRAWVDGRPAEIIRANYAFRAVPIPVGQSEVRMEFRPTTWSLGLAISSIVGLATAAALLATALRRRGG